MTDQDKLLLALENLETVVDIEASSPIRDMPQLKAIVAEDPKIAFYVSGYSIQHVYYYGYKRRFTFDYENTEVPMRDIHIISSPSDFHSLLCQYLGNYKKRLVIMLDGRVNIDLEFNKFLETNRVFYPNFVDLSLGSCTSPLVNMPMYDFQFVYRIGKVKLEMMEQEMDNEVERIAKMLFLPGMSDETKALLAHNYLAYTIQYTLNEKASNLERSYLQSAYGALITRKCVCQGYAEAYKRLMDFAGIPCDVVFGQIKGMPDYHAWNILRLNGGVNNFHVDVTWDSPGGRVMYDYFGLKDSDLSGDRTWNLKYNAKCNSSKNLLSEGRRGIIAFKSRLLSNGVNPVMLGY